MSEVEIDREERVAILKKQEQLAQFQTFTEETAFDLGSVIFGIARAKRAPVVVNIRTSDRVLFHAAMPGATPDNDNWVRRKSNTVLRYHQSSLLFGDTLALKGREINPDMGIGLMDYAGHGGSFPVRIRKSCVVGAITVSGLPQLDDHRMIVEALGLFLKVDLPHF
ncbi:heme-degrading domain-containing protein [Rhizobium sp. KVB221]|uniref:UPF0303 protein JJB09_00565 n=1 Tax=Rhizobium setariae TaxID=2801340 RepID=A0A937CNB4_9HYPH|nr:heme-degrading domain-containing protein [Rhizobium setariae]MBL0370507.1 heme-degrading domain-containing protein [Rhizobium setariae]